MKKMLTAVLISTALLTGTFAYSSDAKPVKSITREIPIESAFQKIAIGNNLQLVLIQDENISAIRITGDENLVNEVNVSIEKGVLTINSKKNLRNKNIRIYVPVRVLTSLDLGGGTSVATEGIVQLNGLKVTVHVDSKVDLNVIGDLEIEAGDDCDLVYEKYEKFNVVYVQR
jgi:hypothetical protein